jgi:hypothetical protein
MKGQMFGWKTSLAIIIEAIELGFGWQQGFPFHILMFVWVISMTQCAMMIKLEELEKILQQKV